MNETALQQKKRVNLSHTARYLLWAVLWAPALALAQYHAPLTGDMATPPEDSAAANPAVGARAGQAMRMTAQQGAAGQAAQAPVPVAPADPVATRAAASAVDDTRVAATPERYGRNGAVVNGAGSVAYEATPARPHEEQVGDVTQLLLAAQSSGVRAGEPLDMLGATATLAWKRYLDSYAHPLPEWFKHAVSNSAAGAN